MPAIHQSDAFYSVAGARPRASAATTRFARGQLLVVVVVVRRRLVVVVVMIIVVMIVVTVLLGNRLISRLDDGGAAPAHRHQSGACQKNGPHGLESSHLSSSSFGPDR